MQLRERKYDIARGIAMMLVVLGHCHHRQIEIFVCLFHMPVFLFISGYFWKDDVLDDPIRFIKKRFKSLYLPYLIYELSFFFLRPLFLFWGWYDASAISWNLGTKGILYEILKIIFLMGREQLLGAFWYIVMLLIMETGYWILSYFVRRLFHNREEYKFGLVFVTWVFGCLIARHVTIPRIGSALIGIPFFYIGYLQNKYHVKLKYNTITILASLLFLIVNTLYGSAAIGSVTIHDPAFQLLCGCAGIYLVLAVSDLIEQKRWKWAKIFDYIGKNTITVMAFHEIGFKLLTTIMCMTLLKDRLILSAIPVGNNGLAYVIPYFVAAMTFSCFMIWIKLKLIAIKKNRLMFKA